jgi:hypothetical protein
MPFRKGHSFSTVSPKRGSPRATPGVVIFERGCHVKRKEGIFSADQ